MNLSEILPHNVVKLMSSFLEIDPEPSKVKGIFMLSRERFIKVKTKEAYEVSFFIFNPREKVENSVRIEVGWRCVFKNIQTKELTNISTENLLYLFESGLISKVTKKKRFEDEEVVKIKKFIESVDRESIRGVSIRLGHLNILDILAFIDGHMIGLDSPSDVVFNNSKYNLIYFLKKLYSNTTGRTHS